MSEFLDLQGAKDLNTDAIHISAVANSVDPVTGLPINTHVNRVGGTDYTLQGFLNALGTVKMPWTSVTGGTLTQPNQAFLHPTDGNYYGWNGVFPKVVAPGTDPTLPGSGYVPRTDVVFRAEITPSVTEALRRSYAEAGFNLIGDFSNTGLVVNSVTDVVLWEPTGVAYAYSGTLPHTIGAGETPVGNPLWGRKDDATLRGLLPSINPLSFGVLGDGTDETVAITDMVIAASESRQEIVWGDREYCFHSIDVAGSYPAIKWRSQSGRTILRSIRSSLGDFIKITGVQKAVGNATAGVVVGATRISLPAFVVSAIDVDRDVIMLSSTRVIETDDRGQSVHGIVTKCARKIDATTIEIREAFIADMRVGDTTGVTVTAVNAGAFQLTCSSLIGQNTTDVRYQFTFQTLAGAASTLTCLPSSFDPATGTFTFAKNPALNSPTGYPTGVKVGDVFTITRKITATVTAAPTVDIDGITFSRAPHLNAVAGSDGFVGIRLDNADRPKITNCTAEWFSDTGISLWNSYDPQIKDIHVHGANRAHDGSDGTGYGISLRGCGIGNVENITGSACRRVVDLGGYAAVCNNTKVRNIKAIGGGTTYTGADFWPVGTERQTVAGSHGASFFSEFDDCYGYQTYGVVDQRGTGGKVGNLYGAGKMAYLAFMGGGGNPILDGLYYTNGRPGWMSNLARDNALSPQGNLSDVIWLDVATAKNSDPLSISNMVIQGVENSIVNLRNNGQVPPVTFGGMLDVQVTYGSWNLGATPFTWFNHIGTGNATFIGAVDFGRPRIRNHPTYPQSSIDLFMETTFPIADGVPVYYPDGSIRTFVSDGAVVSIPCRNESVGWLSLRSNNPPGRPQKCHGVSIAQAGRDTASIGTTTGIDYLAVPLTGTTGTVGNISVSYGPYAANGDRVLQIENRTGERRWLVINFSEAL